MTVRQIRLGDGIVEDADKDDVSKGMRDREQGERQ